MTAPDSIALPAALRDWAPHVGYDESASAICERLMGEAADEIERLRSAAVLTTRTVAPFSLQALVPTERIRIMARAIYNAVYLPGLPDEEGESMPSFDEAELEEIGGYDRALKAAKMINELICWPRRDR